MTLKEALERFEREVVPHMKGHQLGYMVRAWMKHDLALRPLAFIRKEDLAAYRNERLATVKGYKEELNPKSGFIEKVAVTIKPKTVANELGVIQHVLAVARAEWGMKAMPDPFENFAWPKRSEHRDRRLKDDEK